MVGTKIDLVNKRVVSKAEAEECAKGYGYKYVETSAMTGAGVDNCFSLVFEAGILAKHNQKLVTRYLQIDERDNHNISQDEEILPDKSQEAK